jgi:hypothetical protein
MVRSANRPPSQTPSGGRHIASQRGTCGETPQLCRQKPEPQEKTKENKAESSYKVLGISIALFIFEGCSNEAYQCWACTAKNDRAIATERALLTFNQIVALVREAVPRNSLIATPKSHTSSRDVLGIQKSSRERQELWLTHISIL